MFPVLHLGPLAIQTPGLIILVGLWIGLEFAERQAVLFKVEGGKLFNLILFAFACGVIVARLVFAIANPAIFQENILGIFTLSPRMLNLPAGFAAAVLAGGVYILRNRIPIWFCLDALTVFLAVLALSISLADFASGDHYGVPATLPWAIDLWGVTRHPTQVYASLLALGTASLVWPFSRGKLDAFFSTRSGLRFLAWMATTCVWIIFLDFFLADSPIVLGGYHLVQLVAEAVLVACVAAIWTRLSPAELKGVLA